MNVKLLKKIQKHILEEPRRFIMSDVVDMQNGDDDRRIWLNRKKFPPCGAAACIAGWACLLKKEKPDMDVAAALLGLSTQESSRLFLPMAWPEKFEKGTSDDGTMATAKVAARRIDHFIATKGAE